MSNKTITNSDYAFHPGYYVSEIVEDMGISQAEFAMRMGTTPKTLSSLINGKCSMSPELARKISAMLGTDVKMWLDLQSSYDEAMLRIKEAEILDSQLHILSQIDYKYFEKVGSLPSPPEKRERVRYLCGYLNVSDLRLLSQPGFLVSFRAQAHKDDPKYVINANAWVQTAMNHAEKESVSAFSVQRLRDSIPEIREMTLREPGEFLPDLKKTLSQCGVSFVLIPDLKNSGIFGAVKWTGRNSVVLAMNDRHSQVDTFWFSLFHEIRHVMQQKVTSVFIGMEEEELSEKTRIWEEDADRFASDTLIPPKEYRHLLEKEWLSDAAIISFASSISIHPGIVVGRLQHDGIIPFSRCAGLKEKYSFF